MTNNHKVVNVHHLGNRTIMLTEKRTAHNGTVIFTAKCLDHYGRVNTTRELTRYYKVSYNGGLQETKPIHHVEFSLDT